MASLAMGSKLKYVLNDQYWDRLQASQQIDQ